MKIGILTFHRAHNYGAVLQCYALQEVLRSLGYNVVIVDYRQPALEHAYKLWGIKGILCHFLHPKSLFRYIRTLKSRIETSELFDSFSSFLNLTSNCNESIIPSCDAYIVGSDQLWVPQWTGGKMDNVYTGFFRHDEASKIYGYAISLNLSVLDCFSVQYWNKVLDNFNVVSLREAQVAHKLAQKTNRSVRVDIDPTLLLDKDKWDAITNDKWKTKKYLLVYHLPGRYNNLDNDTFSHKVRKIAEQSKLEVISLYPMKYSVEDFVSLFKYAQGVITTSFHATAFSLIYERPLMSIVLNDGYDNRYVNLLNQVGASNALVDKNMNDGVFPILDYDSIAKMLSDYRAPSMEYLKSIK